MDSVRNILAPPKQGPSRQMIHMAKLGQHYDAIFNVGTIKSERQDESTRISIKCSGQQTLIA